VHRGDQRHLGRFTDRAQAQIERPQHGIAPHRSHRGQIQDPAQPFTTALDLALPAQGAAVAIERRHSRQRGDLPAIKPVYCVLVRVGEDYQLDWNRQSSRTRSKNAENHSAEF
jgi:hypothetical protein